MMKAFHFVACLSFTATCAGSPARADAVEDFYRGKSIGMVVSSATGGGYDTISRLVAKHFPRHMPGNPAIVVRNMPGAGGVIATNHLYNVASRDGLTIGQLQNTLPFEPLLDNPEAKYDSSKFNWLGSPLFETGLFITWHATPVASIADIQKREITVGSPGLNSTPSFNTRLLAESLGLKLRIVLGYPGQNEVFLAMERGEIDGFPAFWSSLMSTRPQWPSQGKVRMILQWGEDPEPAIPDVPWANKLVTDPEKALLLKAGSAPMAVGRPFAAPPGLPADRLAALRKALADTFADPEYKAEAARLFLPVNRPRSGEELQKIIGDVWGMPADTRARLRKLGGT